jgi:4-amino-4-deoxychorismate mutase
MELQKQMETLEDFRREIDDLDTQIVESLGRRLEICRRVAHYKKERGIPMMQPTRVNEVIQKCIQKGIQHGINQDYIAKIYTLMIEESCRLENEIIEEKTNSFC